MADSASGPTLLAPSPSKFISPTPAAQGTDPSSSSGVTSPAATFPVTRFVTLALFVAAILGFIFIGMFVILNFYKVQNRRALALLRQNQAQAAQPPRKVPAMYEGFIVSNPCGEEQVAYKAEEVEDENELSDIRVVRALDGVTVSCREPDNTSPSEGR